MLGRKLEDEKAEPFSDFAAPDPDLSLDCAAVRSDEAEDAADLKAAAKGCWRGGEVVCVRASFPLLS